jgi:branched-chain amino acid transport system substrate-binding protein
MSPPATTAALTLSLTGLYERQGVDAAEGVRLWAEDAGIRLILVDDHGKRDAAVKAYAAWTADADGVDLLLGPYSSGLVRAVAPLVSESGALLWNHGGSADDLARPGVVSLLAPASSYFDGIVDAVVARHLPRLVIVQGAGPFACAVAEGAAARATTNGLAGQVVNDAELDGLDAEGAGVLAAGRFEHDVAVVRRLHERGQSPPLLATVAAGISAFGRELGELAEGVLGPAQWWPSEQTPEIGPSGVDFATRYRQRTGREPSYPAAQAAAAGYLAHAAHERELAATDVMQWSTSTLLGAFALDAGWRQVGHQMKVVRWQGGRMVPLDQAG